MDGHVMNDAQDRVRYKSLGGAVAYVLNFLFGNADDEPFYAFDGKTEQGILYPFFIFGGILIIILLTNVIIAIMSDAQA